MKKSINALAIIIAILGLTFTSCQKDSPQPINGKDGKDGKDGNANVKSMIINLNSSDWSGSGDAYAAVKSCPIITTDIQNSGLVMVYIKDFEEYVALPFSISNGSYTSHYFFTTKSGAVTFYVQDDDGFTQNPSNQTFKVVAISASQRQKNPNIDLTDYNQVKKAFNIQD